MDSMDSILQSQLSRFYAAAIQWTTSWYVQTLYLDRRAKMNHSLAPCPAKRTWRAGTTTHGYSMVWSNVGKTIVNDPFGNGLYHP